MLTAEEVVTAAEWLEALEGARRVRAAILQGQLDVASRRELAVVDRCIQEARRELLQVFDVVTA